MSTRLARRLEGLEQQTDAPADAIALVDELLSLAISRRASDLHFEPMAGGLEVRMRIDGLLETVSKYGANVGRSLVARLMVMAHLLTYRLDIPQEGRMQFRSMGVSAMASEEHGRDAHPTLELRLAIMPTTHGLRAAVRMPAELICPRAIDELGLPAQVTAGLMRFAASDSGMLVITGPAGSGKTTTIYALLEHLARAHCGVSIVSLEDPVERDIAGVTQIEVSPHGQLTYERALRSILRQDPQVLMLGEIRDAQTASLAVQAALSGHRLVCTLHASSPAGAIARLLEMGVEPYRITSALYGVIAQRLLRRREPSGRYHGRAPAGEFTPLDGPLRSAILRNADVAEIQSIIAQQRDHVSLRDSAEAFVEANVTDLAEVERVLGPREAAQ